MGTLRIQDYPHLAEIEVRSKQQKRLRVYGDQGQAKAKSKGHLLAGWEIEDAWNSAVAECAICGRIAAIDLSEAPYFFGRAFRDRCEYTPPQRMKG